jgi:hypothetical protein
MRSLHALAFCTVALAFALPAQAGGNDGYLVDKDGRIIKSANTGLCIRSVRWSDKNADRECLEKARKPTLASRK